MAIQLYKAGTDHVINGFECEIVNCKISSMQGMIADGWYAVPGAWIEEVEEIEEEPELDSVRGKAKAAGIEGWDKKRIKTLEAELDEQKD